MTVRPAEQTTRRTNVPGAQPNRPRAAARQDRSSFDPSTSRRQPTSDRATIERWTRGEFQAAYGRAPTDAELQATAQRFEDLMAQGQNAWAAGAQVIAEIKNTDEFRVRNPHAAELDALHVQLYGQAAGLDELDRERALIEQVVAGGGTVENAIRFIGGLMRQQPQYIHAHPFGPFVDKLYGDGLGRTPTADELQRCEAFINQHVSEGRSPSGDNGLKLIFESGQALSFFMRQSEEFKARHPLLPLYDKVFQDNLGRAPTIEEIGKTTELANKLAGEGKNIFEIGQAIQFFIRLGDEYKNRVRELGPPGGALGDGQQVTAYVNGQPSTITVYSVGNGEYLREDAARAYRAMEAEARAAGINISAGSGFRTNAEQQHLYELWQQGRGNLAARPGYSNHQGGVAMDINGVGSYNSAAYAWLRANAGRFGFSNDVGGEYWHWHYTG